MSLRLRLILIFVAATVAPFLATWWIATSLLEHSLTYSTTERLDSLSRTLERTGRELYVKTRDSLKAQAAAGRLAPERFPEAAHESWPPAIAGFWESAEPESFVLSEPEGDRLLYLVRRPGEVLSYSAPIGPVGMTRIADEFRRAREVVSRTDERDLRRGFVSTFILLAAAVWLVALGLLIAMAVRISRPIANLTTALDRVASGDTSVRISSNRNDEIGRAIRAFNGMAAQLEENRDRLVYLAQLASWQVLARKMAHELKNSLTPIRLTMEEIIARRAGSHAPLIEQAARIVVDEVETLERRTRAFSEFAAEPPVHCAPVAVNSILRERIAFLSPGHPDTAYNVVLAEGDAMALADEDMLKGILTNLLENAAEAAGAGGRILAITKAAGGHVFVEIQDSGPGLNPEARRSLFEPAISFKKRGMGLGLSIVRKNALLMGGDVALVESSGQRQLGGAVFRLSLPLASAAGDQLSTKPPASAAVSPQTIQSAERNLIADR